MKNEKRATQRDWKNILICYVSSMVEKIRIKTREAAQNTNFGIGEILRISKSLQRLQGEPNKYIEQDNRK